MLEDLENYWPGATNYCIENSKCAYMWEPYVPVFKPRYVLDGTYAKNRLPIGNIWFAADYIYDAGGNSAVIAARDVVIQLHVKLPNETEKSNGLIRSLPLFLCAIINQVVIA